MKNKYLNALELLIEAFGLCGKLLTEGQQDARVDALVQQLMKTFKQWEIIIFLCWVGYESCSEFFFGIAKF